MTFKSCKMQHLQRTWGFAVPLGVEPMLSCVEYGIDSTGVPALRGRACGRNASRLSAYI